MMMNDLFDSPLLQIFLGTVFARFILSQWDIPFVFTQTTRVIYLALMLVLSVSFRLLKPKLISHYAPMHYPGYNSYDSDKAYYPSYIVKCVSLAVIIAITALVSCGFILVTVPH